MEMDDFKIKNKEGLQLTVTNLHPENYEALIGGMSNNPTWNEYLIIYKDKRKPHFELVKRAIKELGWIGITADYVANDTCFVFSDGTAIGFSWRAWGDLMQAIVGKREGYMKYYMK